MATPTGMGTAGGTGGQASAAAGSGPGGTTGAGGVGGGGGGGGPPPPRPGPPTGPGRARPPSPGSVSYRQVPPAGRRTTRRRPRVTPPSNVGRAPAGPANFLGPAGANYPGP